jgi:hypothetical protein
LSWTTIFFFDWSQMISFVLRRKKQATMELSSITKSIQACSQTVASLIKIAILSKWVTKTYKTTNSKCLVLANGPSVRQSIEEHIEKFSDHDLICVNSFPDTDFFRKLKPKHFIFSAPEYWLEDVLPVYIDMRTSVFKAIEQVDWDFHIYAPVGFKKNNAALEIIRSKSNISISFYNTTPVEGIASISNRLIKMGLGMPRPHNVVVPTLINTINSGYKEITLFGVDHSWLQEISVDDNNVALVNQKHFYDENESKSLAMLKKGKA